MMPSLPDIDSEKDALVCRVAVLKAEIARLREALTTVAHEAHMQGRVYAAMSNNDGITTAEIHKLQAIVDRCRRAALGEDG